MSRRSWFGVLGVALGMLSLMMAWPGVDAATACLWNRIPRPTRWELKTGYGYQYTNNSRPNHYELEFFLPSAVVPLSAPMGQSWYRGHFEWNPELTLAMFSHPYVRPILGVTPLQFRYVLEPHRQLSPYVFAGAGVLYANINRKESGSHVNFNPQCGAGLRYDVTPRTGLLVEYRHIHISNAGLDDRNRGLNAHTFLVGVSIAQ